MMDIGEVRRRSGLSQAAFIRRVSVNIRGPKIDKFILTKLESGDEISNDRRSSVERAIALTFPDLTHDLDEDIYPPVSDFNRGLVTTSGDKPKNMEGGPDRTFSHGRTKKVFVETKRKRVVVPKSKSDQSGSRPPPDKNTSTDAAPVGISDAEMERRMKALKAARAREIEEQRQHGDENGGGIQTEMGDEPKNTEGGPERTFSHGRTKKVFVETKRKRVVVPKSKDDQSGSRPPPGKNTSTEAAPPGISDSEMEQRKEALEAAKAREVEEQLEAQRDQAVSACIHGDYNGALQACIATAKLLEGEILRDRRDLDRIRILISITQAQAQARLGDLQNGFAALKAVLSILETSEFAAREDATELLVRYHLGRSQILLESGDVAGAHSAVRKVTDVLAKGQLDASPTKSLLDAEVAFLQGLTSVASSNWQGAVRTFDTLKQRANEAGIWEDPTVRTTHFPLSFHPAEVAIARGNALLGQGDLAAALTSYGDGLEHLPDPSQETKVRHVLLRVELLLRSGQVALRQGNLFGAERARNEALPLCSAPQVRDAAGVKPANVRVELLDGELLRLRHQAESAISASNRARRTLQYERFPERPCFLVLMAEAEVQKAEAHADLGKMEPAAAAFQDALRLLSREELSQRHDLDELRLTALIGRGVVLASNGKDEEALTSFDEAGEMLDSDRLREARELHPMRARLKIERGASLASLKRLSDAASCYEIAETIFSNGVIDSSPPHNVLRFRLYALKSGLLKSYNHDRPQTWYRKVSGIMAQLLELAPPQAEASSPWAAMRDHYREVHADWLRYSIQNADLLYIPEILAAVQGRETGTEVQDRLGTSEQGSSERRYSDLRKELRRLAEARDLEAHQRLHPELERLRSEAAREHGFELLSAPHRQIRAEDLQKRLEQDEGLLLLFSEPDVMPGATPAPRTNAVPENEPENPETRAAHVVLFRKQGDPVHLVLPELMASTARLSAFAAARGAHRGMRRGAFEGTPVAAPETLESASFWTDLEALQREVLWEALAPYLGGVRRVIGVTHGPLHLLGLTAGAPEGLEIIQYPGLVFFALKRGLYDSVAEASGEQKKDAKAPSPKRVAVLAHDGDGTIPMAAAEGRAVAAIWKAARDVVLVEPCEWPHGERLNLLHVASHGTLEEREGQDPQPVIALGGKVQINEAMIARSVSVDVVFLNICLGGRSSDDPLDGSPSGLVSGFLRAGAKVVIAALPPVPDLWAFVLGLLLTHELAGGEPRAEVALPRAKKRLAVGDWPKALEPALRDAFEEVIVPRVAAHVRSRAGPDIDDLPVDALQAVCNCEAWWFDENALLGLDATLSFIPDADGRMAKIITALTDDARDKLEMAITRRIPLPADLGLLQHGVVAFGETPTTEGSKPRRLSPTL